MSPEEAALAIWFTVPGADERGSPSSGDIKRIVGIMRMVRPERWDQDAATPTVSAASQVRKKA